MASFARSLQSLALSALIVVLAPVCASAEPCTLHAEQVETGSVRLKRETGRIDQPAPLLDVNQFSFPVKNLEMLANYNVELIVDRSMSMHRPDCPGGLSRWNWCGMQAADLARAVSTYAHTGLTIIPFATEYDVFEHATADNIGYIFDNIGLQFGTRLFEPPSERLDNYFGHYKPGTKPLLIAVVTDGVPVPRFEPALVRQLLVDASRRMTSPNQVNIVFFQIGADDSVGQEYLADLGANLKGYGAKYQFVHTVPFEQLQKAGLGTALVAAIQGHIPPTSPASSIADSDEESDDTAFRKFDKFVDTAQTDTAGVHHFANGKHFDLKSVSLADAVESARDSSLGSMRRQNMRMGGQGRFRNRAGAMW